MKKRTTITVIITLLLLLGAFLFGLTMGTYKISISDIINAFMGNGTKMQNMVLFSIRLPRIAVAVAIGVCLSTAGCILQSVTRNELAESGIIGINAGASLAVVLLVSYGGADYYSSLGNTTLYLMPILSFVGALISAVLVYALSYRKGVSPVRLILVGIGINAGINAFITLYHMNMDSGSYNRILTWTNGSLWGSSWKFFYLILPITIAFVGITMFRSKKLDVLDLGDELATGLGLKVEKERRIFLFIAVVLSAAATAVAGNISFLGLLGPHIAKKLVGPVHARQIPVAAIISSIIIVVADTISKNAFSPLEIPVGITISIVGVPYFIYLMMKEKK